MKINLVVTGTVRTDHVEDDCYAVPKQMKIFHQINSPSSITTNDIIDRILANYSSYEARNKKKEAKEAKIIEENEKNAK